METREELGRAVTEALQWLGTSPETAGALLGINARTLNAMCQGIVPMRSLVIRFATGLARHCDRRPGARDWWTDVDAWLEAAGYQPRREAVREAPPERPYAPASPAAAPVSRPSPADLPPPARPVPPD